MKEQGEAHVDVCATFVANVVATYVSRMEVELHKTIVVGTIMLEQESVEPHVKMDIGDMLNLL